MPVIYQYQGYLVKTIGDAYLVTFDSPTKAVLCALAIQAAVAGKFELRIAITMGEVTLKQNDVFGEPVNLAARLQAAAGPGQVFFTQAVYLAMNKNEIVAVPVGPKKFKGIPGETYIYKTVNLQAWWERVALGLAKIPVWPRWALGLGLVVWLMVGSMWGRGQLGKGEVEVAGQVMGEQIEATPTASAAAEVTVTPTIKVWQPIVPRVGPTLELEPVVKEIVVEKWVTREEPTPINEPTLVPVDEELVKTPGKAKGHEK